jgi:hypothetical protein
VIGRACSTHGWEHSFGGKSRKERQLGRHTRRWGDKIKWNLENKDGMVWTGLIWLRIGTSRGLLWTQQWKSGFHINLERFFSSWATGGFWRMNRLQVVHGGMTQFTLAMYQTAPCHSPEKYNMKVTCLSIVTIFSFPWTIYRPNIGSWIVVDM